MSLDTTSHQEYVRKHFHLACIFTFCFVLFENLGPPQNEFGEVVAAVPKFHYLLTATAERVTKLEDFLKRNFDVEGAILLLCGWPSQHFQRNEH